jgi:hypothetical protein
MAWENVDFFELEARWFSDELHNVILPLSEQGYERLEKWGEERGESLKKGLLEAKDDEAEIQTANALADLEEMHNMQRGQVLGAAALHYLYSTLKTRLKELGRYFDKTHPRAPKGYNGKSELDRLSNEYSQRLGVDFQKSPLFDRIKELALARNAGIHLGHETMNEYAEKVETPRFCKDGEFYVKREGFLEILTETDHFFGWVVESLIPIRKAAANAKQTPSNNKIEIQRPLPH